MREETTYIFIDRNILDWGWYKNANVFRVFIHLLIIANYDKHKFENITLKRGQVATSYPSIATATGLTYAQVRRSIENLKLTGELTVKNYPKFLVISIVNYDRYQRKRQGNAQSNDRQTHKQMTTIKEIKKEEKNGRFPNGETAEERKKRLEELRNQ